VESKVSSPEGLQKKSVSKPKRRATEDHYLTAAVPTAARQWLKLLAVGNAAIRDFPD